MSVLEYKCPNCGGKLEFDSASQNMLCPYCDSEINIETLLEFDEKEKRENKEDEAQWNGGSQWTDSADKMNVYSCSNCGGEIISEETTVAMHCPYCDNPVIFTEKLSGVLKPDYVIPFKLSKEDAKAKLSAHFKGKPLLPKIFKDQNHIDEIKGIYVPFWLYDAKVSADVTFEGTKTHVWSDSKYNYTEVSHYQLDRSGSVEFSRIPADGSSKMPDDLMESIEPFDFSDAVDFETAYLSGYLADKYDVTSEENTPRVQQRMSGSILNLLRNTANDYGAVREVDVNTSFSDPKIKYALYPVYILNTTWNGNKYVFAMNGQTGKFVGDLPVSKGKFAAYFAGLSAVYGVVVAALAYLGGFFG